MTRKRPGHEQNSGDDWRDELRRLVSAVADGDATQNDYDRVEAICREHPEAYRRVASLFWLHGELTWRLGSSVDAGPATDHRAPSLPAPAHTPMLHALWRRAVQSKAVVLTATAAAIVFIAVWSTVALMKDESADERRGGSGEQPPMPHEVLAPSTSTDTKAETDASARLRKSAMADARLRHYYSFDASSSSTTGMREALADRRGRLDLMPVVMAGGRGHGGVQWPVADYGGNAMAVAMNTHGVDASDQGEGLQTADTIEPGDAFSIAMLLRMTHEQPGGVDATAAFFPSGEDATAIVQGETSLPSLREIERGAISDRTAFPRALAAMRSSREQCGVLLAVTPEGHPACLLADNAPWTVAPFRFERDIWYYVVVAFDTRASESRTLVDMYVVQTDDPEGAVLHVLDDEPVQGVVPKSARLGVGKGFAWPLSHAYPWTGALDEVAVYEGLLQPSDIDRHAEALSRQE